MADDSHPTSKPLAFRPRAAKLLDMVRALAADTSNIRWSRHALDRMMERGIVDLMAIEVLRGGHIPEDPLPGRVAGEWKVKLVKMIKGRRELGVVTLVIRQQSLLIKTVEWEDCT